MVPAVEALILESCTHLIDSPHAEQPNCTKRAVALCNLMFESKIHNREDPGWIHWCRTFYRVSRAGGETFTSRGQFYTAGDLYLMHLKAEDPEAVPDFSVLPPLPELSTFGVA